MRVQLVFAAIVFNRILQRDVEESLILESKYGNIHKLYFIDNSLREWRFARKHFVFPSQTHIETARKSYLNEIRITQKLDHSNIIQAWPEAFDDGKIDIEYIMELGDVDSLELVGNLYQQGKDPRKLVTRLIVQMLNAVEYMQSMNVSHLDIEPDNIVYFEHGQQFKLIDFGFAVEFRLHVQVCNAETEQYIVPKVSCLLDRHALYNAFKADIYSLGITFWTLYVYPYSGGIKVCFNPDEDTARYDPNGIHDLFNKMTHCRPENRRSIAELKRHPWVVNAANYL